MKRGETVEKSAQNKEIFETMPVPKALATLALPTIASQLITMIYNLADTFFIGLTEDPYKVAASSLSFTMFFFIHALATLWGTGGSTLVSRMLGQRRTEEAKGVCTVSVCGGLLISAVYSLICLLFMEPMLMRMGASANTVGYACDYTLWATVIGGIPSCLCLILSNLLRGEGHARQASIGLGLGGVLNIALDPLLMFVVLPKGMEITGAALATMASNVVCLVYLCLCFRRLRGTDSVLAVELKRAPEGLRNLREIMAVGVPSFFMGALSSFSAMLVNILVSGYGDIPLAALGIVKKLDMLPMNLNFGLCQGMVPLIAYNYAAKNYDRMTAVFRFTAKCAFTVAGVCVVVFELLPGAMVGLFIRDGETVALGARLLRIMCVAVLPMAGTFLCNSSFQAMGKGRQTLLLSCSRQGLVCIPLMFLMHAVWGLYGTVAAQPVADLLTMVLALLMFRSLMARLRAEEAEGSGEKR